MARQDSNLLGFLLDSYELQIDMRLALDSSVPLSHATRKTSQVHPPIFLLSISKPHQIPETERFPTHSPLGSESFDEELKCAIS
jgi:hypothetical protein